MLTKSTMFLIALVLPFSLLSLPGIQFTQRRAAASTNCLPGLQRQVTVVRDTNGVPHITASGDRDVYFMMGYMHANDRFFQMDTLRRQATGSLAELLGAGPNDLILGTDVQLRFFGMGRAAERSLSSYTPETLALIQAYSDGVNAWLDRHSLPPEYAALEIARVPRWTALDSVSIVKLIQFQLSFDPSDLERTGALLRYQATGQALGFNGAKLFFEDIFRSAPFDPVVTIPGPAGAAARSSQSISTQVLERARSASETISPGAMEAAGKLIGRYNQNPLLNRDNLGIGSNWWVVAGSKTETGNAMLANDPHLLLTTPSTFYEIHLRVESPSSPMNVYGVSFAGVPSVILGQNERISWGATTSATDVLDFFAERLVIEDGVPVATLYRGRVEPLVLILEEFKVNQVQNGVADDVVVVGPGDRPSGVTVPPVTLIAPRRNDGPLLPGGSTDAVSIQYTGASATRDLEGFFILARARNLSDFKRVMQLLEVGSFNWAYADVEGNIATFVNGKIPLREDLQAGVIEGLPPFFLRDGSGAFRNEWIPSSESGPGVNFESLPFDEMPQVVNPAQGFLVNANNDPIGITLDNDPVNQTRGEGLYYISPGFGPGIRAAKITGLLQEQFGRGHGHGKVSFQDLRQMQSNVQMFDAEVLTPYILRAFEAIRGAGAPAELAALAHDPAVSEAVGRLSRWDFSAPTGIAQGFDAGDRLHGSQRPSRDEAGDSIAATIYTVWRSRILANTIVATLQRVGLEDNQPSGELMMADLRFLLDNFATNQGVGASGLDFFAMPGVDAPPNVRRDSLILKSLKEALNLLAGESFAAAFGGSTDQDEYRWGKLHRITFSHAFGALAPQFSIPTAGNFANLSPALPGLAVDGGWETIDNAPFEIRGASSQAYTFAGGPARRYVGELRRGGIKSVQVIPGGERGVLGDRFYADQLRLWLTNDHHRVLVTKRDVDHERYSVTVYTPAR